MHYGGVACDMTALAEIAGRHGLPVIEDAAQGLLASYRGRPLGSLGALAAVSFHETKNIISGEGGALVVNDARYAERAEILWEKGTDRSKFTRGEVEKYTWMDLGSSFLPGELTAAFLWAQLEEAAAITTQRLALWEAYRRACAGLAEHGVELASIPDDCAHNAHLFRLQLPRGVSRSRVLVELNRRGVNAVFHYVPLHSAPAGRRLGRVSGTMAITDDRSARLVRLPLWVGMDPSAPVQVAAEVAAALATLTPTA